MKSALSLFLSIFLLLDAGLMYFVQRNIDSRKSAISRLQELGNLPKGEYLKKVSLGQDSLVADLIWLRVIQVMGEKKIPPKNAEWIYHALDAATDLDPKFWYMSEAGGIFLTAVTGNHDLSIKLLKKGFDNNPDIWELPFYIGFNYFFYLENFKQAAYYIGRAAELPKRPAYLPLLASRLYAQAGDPRVGLALTETIYRNTKDEKVKDALRQRMKELHVEINLNVLESAGKEYKARFGRYPASVSELMSAGLIQSEPRDELGGKYILDPNTGEASNTKMPKRLKVYHKGQ